MQGAEPFSAAGGPEGVLVLHGFTGNPFSMRTLAQRLGEAGHTVELPLLPGHGTAIDDMIETRWDDWSSAAEAAYRGSGGPLPRASPWSGSRWAARCRAGWPNGTPRSAVSR